MKKLNLYGFLTLKKTFMHPKPRKTKPPHFHGVALKLTVTGKSQQISYTCAFTCGTPDRISSLAYAENFSKFLMNASAR
jgi:hypothetical protein